MKGGGLNGHYCLVSSDLQTAELFNKHQAVEWLN